MNIHNPEIDHGNVTWDNEDATKLVSMTLDGCSAREIANAIGTTRNAVIGKQARLQARGVLPKRPKEAITKDPKPKKRKPRFDWSRANIKTLKSMWADGHTAASIATALGASRDSVLGVIHRLGINRILGDEADKRLAEPVAMPARSHTPPPSRASSSINAAMPGPGIPIEGLLGKTGRCKFGLWGVRDYPALESKLVCGRPSLPGKSWCEHCHQIVYPPKIKRAA